MVSLYVLVLAKLLSTLLIPGDWFWWSLMVPLSLWLFLCMRPVSLHCPLWMTLQLGGRRRLVFYSRSQLIVALYLLMQMPR